MSEQDRLEKESRAYEPPMAEDIDTTSDPAETVAVVAYGPPTPGLEGDRWH